MVTDDENYDEFEEEGEDFDSDFYDEDDEDWY